MCRYYCHVAIFEKTSQRDREERADTVDEQQAAKEATAGYPGKVVSITSEDSAEGRKQFAVIVQSGVYERKVMVDVESGVVDTIYYRVAGKTAWIAKKVPIGTKLT